MKFYSRGKLLISGEYLVLNGAIAIAVPLKKGQNLLVSKNENIPEFTWQSNEYAKPWFSAKIQLPFFDIIETTDQKIAENLVNHLKRAIELNPEFEDKLQGAEITTDLEFDRNWGFGSSSSLVSNVAHWAGVDPFLLHQKVSIGSGYDVILSGLEGPAFFCLQKTGYKVEDANFNKEVTESLYFVYLGNKMDSAESVTAFRKSKKSYRLEIRTISDLSRHMIKAAQPEDFQYYMKEHEQIMSSVLKISTLKEKAFNDLNGEIKSLGAWGGDFAMISFNGDEKEFKKYINNKKLDVWFTFDELVKTR